MSRIIAIVEGRTEQTFVREVLAPWLGARNVFVEALLVGRPGHKGGVGSYPRAQRDILTTLTRDCSVFVTTMFDFYGMPTSWPGRRQAGGANHVSKPLIVESELSADIAARMGRNFDRRRFLPYVQMYEFEALLFSKPEAIAEAACEPLCAKRLNEIRAAFDSPEMINDGRETAPSKRIEKLCTGYQKLASGAIAAQNIGIALMLSACPHFREWVQNLINTAT